MKPCRFCALLLTAAALCLLPASSVLGKGAARSDIAELGKHVGEAIAVRGRVSSVPWQHLMGGYGRHSFYFDVGKLQTVVYSKDEVKCRDMVEVFGKVVEMRGRGKGTKMDEEYIEYQIVADKWKCL